VIIGDSLDRARVAAAGDLSHFDPHTLALSPLSGDDGAVLVEEADISFAPASAIAPVTPQRALRDLLSSRARAGLELVPGLLRGGKQLLVELNGGHGVGEGGVFGEEANEAVVRGSEEVPVCAGERKGTPNARGVRDDLRLLEGRVPDDDGAVLTAGHNVAS